MPPYTIDVLARLTGVTPRTIRYYVSQGLLPAAQFAGPGTRYDDRHLALVRAIKRMQADHLPLANIRDRLRSLSEEEIDQIASAGTPPPAAKGDALSYIRGVLGQPTSPVPPPAAAPVAPAAMGLSALSPQPAPASATAPASASATAPANATPAPPQAGHERSQWERIVLEPDIELHIRRPLSRQQNRRVDRLVALARELMNEEE